MLSFQLEIVFLSSLFVLSYGCMLFKRKKRKLHVIHRSVFKAIVDEEKTVWATCPFFAGGEGVAFLFIFVVCLIWGFVCVCVGFCVCGFVVVLGFSLFAFVFICF